MAIELHNLHKRFDAASILNGINLKLKEHSVLGLLGVNGAGKTTLIRCALGLQKVSDGEALIYGEEAWNLPPEIKSRIGFVPQVPDLFHWMTAEQMLAYTGAYYRTWDKDKVLRLLIQWDLVGSMRISKMSEGQKQRLAIINAMGHSPDLLVLDEPVSALDPVGRREFIRQLIDMNANEGKTILFSTHIVSDLERVAAEVAIVRDGRIYFQGEIDDLKENIVRLQIRSSNSLPELLPIENQLSSTVTGNSASVCVRGFEFAQLETLKSKLNAVVEVQHLGLEDIFLEVNQK